MNIKQRLLILFLILPSIAFAHGEEVLLTVGISFVSIVIFLIFINLIKLKFAKKLILSAIFSLSTFLVWEFTNTTPYRPNMGKINLLIASVPVVTTLLAYFIITQLNNRRV